MKKLIALLLVVMMLGSTAAFADDNASIGDYAPETYTAADATQINTPYTELWLQVDASGQIDVTVPLVLVFKTDIDGGTATSPETYMMTNNSSADLVVTAIATSVQATTAGSQPMTLVEYTTTDLTRDQYKVQLSVPTGVVVGTDATNGWDLFTASHSNDKVKGGLFELAKDGTTRIIADMSTGELSFITPRATTDAGADNGMDTTKGVHLLTVTYTVAIDTSDAIGTDITDDPNHATGTTGVTDTANQPINNT